MGTVWEHFSQNIFSRQKKFPKSSLSDRKARKCASTFSEQYMVWQSCKPWYPVDGALQMKYYRYQTFHTWVIRSTSLRKCLPVSTVNYLLVTCDIIGTVVLRLDCGCTKMFPKCSQIYCPEIQNDLRRLWQNIFLRTIILAEKKMFWEKCSQNVPLIFADRKGVRQGGCYWGILNSPWGRSTRDMSSYPLAWVDLSGVLSSHKLPQLLKTCCWHSWHF